MTIIYKNELEEKDVQRIFEEAKKSLDEQKLMINQSKIILNEEKKESIVIQQDTNTDVVELIVTIKWIDHRDLYARFQHKRVS